MTVILSGKVLGANEEIYAGTERNGRCLETFLVGYGLYAYVGLNKYSLRVRQSVCRLKDVRVGTGANKRRFKFDHLLGQDLHPLPSLLLLVDGG